MKHLPFSESVDFGFSSFDDVLEVELDLDEAGVDFSFFVLDVELRLLDFLEEDGRFGFSNGGLKMFDDSLRDIFDPEFPVSSGLSVSCDCLSSHLIVA